MASSRRDFLKQATTWTVATSAGLTSLRCARPAATPAPTAASELSSYDGMALAQMVRDGEVTPLELVEDTVRRIEAVNPQINAVLPELFDVELARARARGDLGDGPLSGVPVLLKNLISYADADIDSGSRLFARAVDKNGRMDEQSSPLIQAMERTGMIIAGITNSPELGLIDTTEPLLHGPTRNPWNTGYTAGGSSGGSAAAVAAGIAPIGHANDGGGSIRLPASQCGLFGLKPTRGRELGSQPGDQRLAIANDLCVSRTVRDSAAFLSVVEDPDNPLGLPTVGMVDGPSGKQLRIALLTETFAGEQPHEEVEKAVRQSAELCQELGHTIEEVSLPFDGQEFIDAFIGFWATGTVRLDDLVDEWLGSEVADTDVLEPWTLGLIALAEERGVDQCLARALEVFPRVSERLETLFQSHDVLLSPVLREPPYPIGHHDPAGDFEVVLERVLDKVGYTPLHNAAGTPAMSVPLHWTPGGLPVGTHFAAWRGGESTLLELAYQLEEARPWQHRRPPIYAS